MTWLSSVKDLLSLLMLKDKKWPRAGLPSRWSRYGYSHLNGLQPDGSRIHIYDIVFNFRDFRTTPRACLTCLKKVRPWTRTRRNISPSPSGISSLHGPCRMHDRRRGITPALLLPKSILGNLGGLGPVALRTQEPGRTPFTLPVVTVRGFTLAGTYHT